MKYKLLVCLSMLIPNVMANWDSEVEKNEAEINEDPKVSINDTSVNNTSINNTNVNKTSTNKVSSNIQKVSKRASLEIVMNISGRKEFNKVTLNDVCRKKLPEVAKKLTNEIRKSKQAEISVQYDNDLTNLGDKNSQKLNSFSNTKRAINAIAQDQKISTSTSDYKWIKEMRSENQDKLVTALKADEFKVIGDSKITKALLGNKNVGELVYDLVYGDGQKSVESAQQIYQEFLPKETVLNNILSSNDIIKYEDISSQLLFDNDNIKAEKSFVASIGGRIQGSYFIQNSLYITAGIGFEQDLNKSNIRVATLKNLGLTNTEESNYVQHGIYIKRGTNLELLLGLGWMNNNHTMGFEFTFSDKIGQITCDQQSVRDTMLSKGKSIYSSYISKDDLASDINAEFLKVLPSIEKQIVHTFCATVTFKQYFGNFGYGISLFGGFNNIKNTNIISDIFNQFTGVSLSLSYRLY